MTTTNQTAVSTPVIDVEEVFKALEKWIGRRPGLDYRNYGQLAPYRAELRSIAQDKRRALKALEEARGLTPARPELLAEAFKRAFSGRLEWTNGITCKCAICQDDMCKDDCAGNPREPWHLEYCTGQYFPTEYRKAAASVLETYIATWRQAEAEEHPRTFTYQTIEDVKAANRQIGGHWFDRSTMRFFNTKIESGLIGGKYFITSERRDDDCPRLFTVREARPDGGIGTVGEFQGYQSREDARDAVRVLAKTGRAAK